MRLRLGLLFEDLAYRFDIAKSTASSIFSEWINVMAVQLKFLIKWPPREIIQSNMPQPFKQTYHIVGMPVEDSICPDYIPCIFSHKPIPLKALKQKQERLERAMRRRHLKVFKEGAKRQLIRGN